MQFIILDPRILYVFLHTLGFIVIRLYTLPYNMMAHLALPQHKLYLLFRDPAHITGNTPVFGSKIR
jgi:hypothetical protein